MPKRTPQLADVLTYDEVRRLAGVRSFARGSQYQDEGRVRSLSKHRGTVTAVVHGTIDYTVKLWVERGGVGYSCTCPVGDDGAFCKHCAAAAFEVLVRDERGDPETARDTVTLEDVRARLLRQDKENLVELLMQQVEEQPDLRRHLLLEAARERPEGLDLRPFFEAVDEAVAAHDFVSYREAYAYTAGISKVVSSLRELVTKEHASRALEVIEYARVRVAEAFGWVDDSSGNLASILVDLQELHHEACVLARPDPVLLAEKLFAWELADEYGVFSGADRAYADLLGERGRARFRELAEAEWRQVRPLAPGEDEDGKYGRRWRITSIMERLARDTGDTNALVAVMARDLSGPDDFLQIAQVYQQAGRSEDAVQWAERGVAAFPEAPDARVREFLAEQYHRLGRHEEATELAWTTFTLSPRLDTYRHLKQHADHTRQWPIWREKALAHLRRSLARAKTRPLRDDLLAYHPAWGHSLLVEIFLWEEDPEAAWQEAQAGGCREDQWLELARRREQQHPEDALAVYQRFVEPTIAGKNNEAYAKAVDLLHKISKLMARLDRRDEFARYLEDLRRAHKPKRNLMALLDRARWE